MSENFTFIYEAPNHQRLRILFIAIIIFLFFIGITVTSYYYLKDDFASSASFQNFKAFIKTNIANFTPLGLFYFGFTGGLFFIPLPIEAFFITSLSKGHPPLLALVFVLSGIFPSQVIDYLVGVRFSNVIMHLISKKNVYKVRRYVNKYGAPVILVFNLLPLPSPVLTFALGIAKYNPWRLAFYLIMGTLIKFSVIIWFFSFVG